MDASKTWMKVVADQCLFQISFQVSCVSPFPEWSFDGSTWYVCFDKFINLVLQSLQCLQCQCWSVRRYAAVVGSLVVVGMAVMVGIQTIETKIASLSIQPKLHRNQLTENHTDFQRVPRIAGIASLQCNTLLMMYPCTREQRQQRLAWGAGLEESTGAQILFS